MGERVWVVRRGPKTPLAHVTVATDDEAFARGFAAGLNHTGKKYWFYVQRVDRDQLPRRKQ